MSILSLKMVKILKYMLPLKRLTLLNIIVNTEFLSIFLAITILHQVNVSNTSFQEILPMSKLIRILSLIKENCGDVCEL